MCSSDNIAKENNINEIKESINNILIKEKTRLIQKGDISSLDYEFISPLHFNIDEFVECDDNISIIITDCRTIVINYTKNISYSTTEFIVDNMKIPNDISGSDSQALSKFINNIINRASDFKIYDNNNDNNQIHYLPRKLYLQPNDVVDFKDNKLTLKSFVDNYTFEFIL